MIRACFCEIFKEPEDEIYVSSIAEQKKPTLSSIQQHLAFYTFPSPRNTPLYGNIIPDLLMAPLTSLFELDIDDFSSPDGLYVRSYLNLPVLGEEMHRSILPM
ncbi:hypothetical protein AFLA70_5g008792 [Aspergillus flavus AF70]|nr:hypothetical protein AFLA70_5g008792 [Aspergillus flavus AF70]